MSIDEKLLSTRHSTQWSDKNVQERSSILQNDFNARSAVVGKQMRKELPGAVVNCFRGHNFHPQISRLRLFLQMNRWGPSFRIAATSNPKAAGNSKARSSVS